MRPSVRPHGVSLQTFPRLPVRFTHPGYGCLWDFAVLSQLIHMVRLIPAVTAMDTATSCPSGHDFAIPSSRLFLTVQTLGVAIGFVGNYAPWDFHPRFGTCPSHRKRDPLAQVQGISFSFVLFMCSHHSAHAGVSCRHRRLGLLLCGYDRFCCKECRCHRCRILKSCTGNLGRI